MSAQNNIYDVCKYIIHYENKNGKPVTNLRLQKLLYFIQVYFWGAFGRPCFNEELRAWKYGPVVVEVYERYKFFGSLSIIQESIVNSHSLIPNEEDRIAIEQVLDSLRNLSTNSLVDFSHRQSPWKDAYQTPESDIISNESIQRFVHELA